MKLFYGETIVASLLDLLQGAVRTLDGLRGAEAIVAFGTGFGDLENDTEIEADVVLGEYFAERIAALNDVGRITAEGLGERTGTGTTWWCVDPLDGSLNYALRGNTMGLPYTACITVLEKTGDAAFSDVIAAGILDLRNGDHWLARRNQFGVYRTVVNGYEAFTMPVTELDLGSQVVIGEMYYPENRIRLVEAFAGEKGWLRSIGSAAYEMALVASGQAAAFLCGSQKQHELGAAYALVMGAGGLALDFDGSDLGPQPFTFNTPTPAVLAANSQIATQILERLQR